MTARKRHADEPFEDYRKNLKKESVQEKLKFLGKMLYESARYFSGGIGSVPRKHTNPPAFRRKKGGYTSKATRK